MEIPSKKKKKRKNWKSLDTMNSTLTVSFKNRAYSVESISSQIMMTYSTGSTRMVPPIPTTRINH